jgi:hypothetical protein
MNHSQFLHNLTVGFWNSISNFPSVEDDFHIAFRFFGGREKGPHAKIHVKILLFLFRLFDHPHAGRLASPFIIMKEGKIDRTDVLGSAGFPGERREGEDRSTSGDKSINL